MAFLGEDGWKSGLSVLQQNKVSTLEKERELYKNEVDKNKMNADFLTQTLEKEKRRAEDEKSEKSIVQKELQELSEKLTELERKNQKLEHDLHAREQHASTLQVSTKSSSKIWKFHVLPVTQILREINY